MRILSISAQKPDSTGSGIYMTELIKAVSKMGHEQAAIAGISRNDVVSLPEEVEFFPVYFDTEKLPKPMQVTTNDSVDWTVESDWAPVPIPSDVVEVPVE